MTEEAAEQAPETSEIENFAVTEKEHTYVLKERYTIDFSAPLVWLDTNGAKAYKVEDKIEVFKKWLLHLDQCEQGFPLDNIEYIKGDLERYDQLIERLRTSVLTDRERISHE